VKQVLFHRDFRGFTGGHLKLWHYFDRVRRSGTHWPHIRFTEQSRWDQTNPWWPIRKDVLDSWRHIAPDVLFLEGLDWERIETAARDHSPIPVLNLIQGIRHANPESERYAFLRHRAVRICVSGEVEQAIAATGMVNGPVFVIPNGLDLPAELPRDRADRDVLIVAVKNPDLGAELRERLRAPVAGGGAGGRLRALLRRDPLRVEALTRLIPRAAFLEALRGARVAVFLPRRSEGFYLPALEAMAVGALVVCPDAGGNRSFCLPGHNCLQPEYTLDEIEAATAAALALPRDDRETMLERARETASRHSLEVERRDFLRILQNLEAIW
jgi:glycosyltransferase involved in cell wall biosynthesis